MTYGINILDGNRNFMCSLQVNDKDKIIGAIQHEAWVKQQGFRPERRDFLPLDYQVAGAEVFDLNDEGNEPVARWGRNTGMVWLDSL